MVISKRIDYRKRKRREVFFGMPFIPLAIFLLMIIVLLLVPNFNASNNTSSSSMPEIPGEFEDNYVYDYVTGEVVGGLNLTKTSYSANEDLSGNFVLRFYQGDLIPYNSLVNFTMSSIKCKHYYACSFANYATRDGVIRWEVFNRTLGRCVNVTDEGWVYGPWENCGENYNTYSCPSALKCCDAGKGIGGFYANLQCTGNKECWDKCSSTISKSLSEVILRSTTPWNGNYTYNGLYNNTNATPGNQLSGSGPGFGYCYYGARGQQRTYIPGQGVTGFAAQQPPPQQPDLTVIKIELREVGVQPPGSQPGAGVGAGMAVSGTNGGFTGTKKVYAQIKNIGNAPASNFVVRGEWNSVSYMLSIENYKEETVAYLGPNQVYNFSINDLDAIKDMELTVTADYYNDVQNEMNETNNEKKTYLGCIDLDGGNNTQTQAKCFDFTEQYSYEDYCDLNVENYLNEYTCQPTMIVWPFEKVCSASQVQCEYSCERGKCVGGVQPACVDTDNDTINNPNYFVKGTCSVPGSPFPVFIPDQCDENNPNILIEQDCNAQAQCQGTSVDCSQLPGIGGMICLDGICQLPPKPDLIIEKITRTSDTKRALIFIKNIGNGVANPPFNLLVNLSLGVNATEIIPITSSLGPGNSYPQPSNANIEGKTVSVYAYADINNSIVEDKEDNNNKTTLLLPYSCDNWTNPNIYYTSLKNLGLKAPEYSGVYTLNMIFSYQDKLISSGAVNITVSPTVPVKKCSSDDTCITVSCNPDTQNCTDKCSSNADCRGVQGCYESWQYASWTECIQGKMQRECYDARNCSTTDLKPQFCLKVGTKYLEIKDCCTSSWSCDEWSACYEAQGAMIQSMTCSDLNRCNPQNTSYTQLRDCCQEDWSCTWSPCINGIETLSCEELNGCGTEFTKPQGQSRGCKVTGAKALAWWIILIIVFGVIIVTLVVLFSTGVIKFPKKAKVEKEAAAGAAAGAGAYPELTNYVKSAIAAGMSKDEIKKKLIDAGWPQDAIDSELGKV